MNIADEIAKLEALHKSGALSDDEFAKAKAALLNPTQPTAHDLGTSILAGCGVCLVIMAILSVGLFFAWPKLSEMWTAFSKTEEALNDLLDQNAEFRLAQIAPREIFLIDLDSGVFNHDIKVTNKTADTLSNTVLSIILVKEDGSKTEETKRYQSWPPGESNTIRISASGTVRKRYSINLSGTTDHAPSGAKRRTVPIVQSWNVKPK